MQTCGEFKPRITCNGRTKEVRIIVTERGTELILGFNFCKTFGLVFVAECCIQRKVNIEEKVKAVHIRDESKMDYSSLQHKWKQHWPLGKRLGDPLKDLKAIFPEIFDGSVGWFEGEVKLQVIPEAKPVQLAPRSTPISILPKLKEEWDKMERQGIIQACPETTEWVHNLVIVSKKNGDIRVCLDSRNLNKYRVCNLQYTASWEDAQHSFQEWKVSLNSRFKKWLLDKDVKRKPATHCLQYTFPEVLLCVNVSSCQNIP